MRTSRFAMLVLGVAALAGFASIGPAAAMDPYDYPWCIQGKETGYPGACFYQTYAQCQATASGRYAYCGINPRFAFDQSQHEPRRSRRISHY